MQQIFETMPLDMLHKTYKKIVYLQSKELLDELKAVFMNRKLMRLFNQGKCHKFIPSISEVQVEMHKVYGFVEKLR